MWPGPRRCQLHGPQALAVAALTLLSSVGAASAACLRGGPDLSNLGELDSRAAADGALLELTNATLAARLEAASSAQRYIIFTTTSAWQPELINMTLNWFGHIQRCGAADRSMRVEDQRGRGSEEQGAPVC